MLNVNAACVAACITILHEHDAYHSPNKASSTDHAEPRGETLSIRSADLINWLIFPICNPKERDVADVAEPKGGGVSAATG
jgi:hypothetical protein